MRTFATISLLLALTSTAVAESIWKRAEMAGRARNPIEDDRATREGDLLQVIVREKHKLELDETLDRSRKGNLDVALTNFDLKPDTFTTPLPAVKGRSTRTFAGEAEYEKEGTFEARITVQVVDVLPNGNLVVAGRRSIVMDGEEKVLRLAGLVRPTDVTAANTVLSEQVADARISFKGHGTVSRPTEPGPLDPIWHFLGALLPF
jgi:flagellar L-ring protein precursor FlgH